MRGVDGRQEELFTVAGGLDQYIPPAHPLRAVRDVFDDCLKRMDGHFDTLYSPFGRDARLFKKSQGSEAHLSYLGHALTENRHTFVVAATVTQATGTAEREAALVLVDQPAPQGAGRPAEATAARQRTLGADKNYDTADFVAACRSRNITPHVAQNTRRLGGSAIDGRTTRHAGYAVSQTKRQIAEHVHAWPKTWSTMKRVMVRGLRRVKAQYQLALTGSNLMRLVHLTG